MKTRTFFAAFTLVAISATPAWAAWIVGDPTIMAVPQLPDVTSSRIDVLAGPMANLDNMSMFTPPTSETFVADDWIAGSDNPITEIHVWGAFNHQASLWAPAAPKFSLVIFSDAAGPLSFHPGEVVWQAYLAPSNVEVYANQSQEFFDPNCSQIVGFCSPIYEYTFNIEPDEAFVSEPGVWYWFGLHYSFDFTGDDVVSADDLRELLSRYPGAGGWHSSSGFGLAAVRAEVNTLGRGPHIAPLLTAMDWHPLVDPRSMQPINFSFVLAGVPEPAGLLLAAGMIASLGARVRRRS